MNPTYFLRIRSLAWTGILIALVSGAAHCEAAATPTRYRQTNLVSNVPGIASRFDRLLIGPWGLAVSPTEHLVVANNTSGTYTTYDGAGIRQPSQNKIFGPPALAASPGPTGVAHNSTDAFILGGRGALPSPLLFATQAGTISGEYADPNGNILQGTILAVDNSRRGAVYTGLAISSPDCCAPFIAVANFHSRFIETYTVFFDPLGIVSSFNDVNLPAGYAPFNIQVIGKQIFVTYARQNATKHDPLIGAGNGIVDIYDLDGGSVKRFASNGQLNAPWGVAKAGPRFGGFSNDILIGNFGDGTINVFNPITGAFVGKLTDTTGKTIVIPGLRGIVFGASGIGDSNTLYFTASTAGQHNLFGSISVAP